MVRVKPGRSCAKAFLFFAPLVVACAPQAGSAPRSAAGGVGAEVSDETIRSIRQFVVMVSGDGAGDNGSGVVVSKQGREYTVFTNDHVLKPETRQQRIITPDGALHVFEVVRREQGPITLDLAVLKFSSDKEYSVAPLREMADLQPGETIVVAGFPAEKKRSTCCSRWLPCWRWSQALCAASKGFLPLW